MVAWISSTPLSASKRFIRVEGLLPVRLGLVGELDAGLQPPEQVGHQGEIAARGHAVGDVAHHLIDAENFLDDDQARAAPGARAGEIAGEAAVLAFDGDGLSAHISPHEIGAQVSGLAAESKPFSRQSGMSGEGARILRCGPANLAPICGVDMTGQRVTISGKDGNFGGYLASPASGRGPGIVVIQEIFGVNQVMRDIADGLASRGFFALVPGPVLAASSRAWS